jgi:outer membrane protein assembly factor BamE (lipoprotein component of BamABCDE complex)
MIHRIIQLLLVGAFLVSCATSLSSIEKASANYSLEIIYKNLSKGMQRKEVERLLGEPDYSPIDGQYYYSSNRSAYAEDQGREVAIGVVVDYRDRNGDITEKLQEFWLGPIGE